MISGTGAEVGTIVALGEAELVASGEAGISVLAMTLGGRQRAITKTKRKRIFRMENELKVRELYHNSQPSSPPAHSTQD